MAFKFRDHTNNEAVNDCLDFIRQQEVLNTELSLLQQEQVKAL